MCCRCNGSGRCKNCSCVKNGSKCVDCLPARKGRCANRDNPEHHLVSEQQVDSQRNRQPEIHVNQTEATGAQPQPPSASRALTCDAPATCDASPRVERMVNDDADGSPDNSDLLRNAQGPVSSNDIICNECYRPIYNSDRLLCSGGCGTSYHLECIDSTVSSGEWLCMQCLIIQCKQGKVLRHIPKGARIQTAQALAEAIQNCVSQPSNIASWQKLFSFSSTALRVPQAAPISKKHNKKISLTTAVKQQVEAFSEGAQVYNFQLQIQQLALLPISHNYYLRITN